MARNIEIKARIHDLPRLKTTVKSFADTAGLLLRQTDIVYFVTNGRLKLRKSRPGGAELIFYQRANTTDAKTSKYSRAFVSHASRLNAMLSAALGVRGQVKKERLVYLCGQTRIHIDRVEGLGNFVELEYVLRRGEREENGRAAVSKLLSKLGVRKKDLIACSYIDLVRWPDQNPPGSLTGTPVSPGP